MLNKNSIYLLLKYVFLLVLGGAIYCMIEIVYRGYTHFSMFFLGGICFIVCGLLNEIFSWDTPLVLQCAIATVLVTILEFITGIFVNLILEWNVWDYSNLPFNVFGQICLPFMIIWYALTAVAIIVDDYIRYYLFNEERPRYKLF